VDEAFLARAGFALRPSAPAGPRAYWTADTGMLARLQRQVTPHHDWPLIYLTLTVYLLVVGPLNYLLVRRTGRPRLAAGLFGVAVVLFGCAIGALGSRGFGETASVHSLAYAEPVADDQYDVTQWVNVFVTRGGYYTLTHAGSHNLYATCQSLERVRGAVEAGAAGRFAVDMPLFSNRGFLYRGKLAGPALGVTLHGWEGEKVPQSLTFTVGPDFPQQTLDIWAVHRGALYGVSRQGQQLQAVSPRRQDDLAGFAREAEHEVAPWYWELGQAGAPDFQKVCSDLARALVVRAEGIGTEPNTGAPSVPPMPADRVDLFVLAPSPESFAVQAQGLGKEIGYVLYHVRLFRPENSDG
jgi:hypothetical protein